MLLSVCYQHIILLVLCPGLLLAGCGSDLPSYAAVQETARVRGCWPDTGEYPTPLPITVTPSIASPILPGTPTAVPWQGATTTPYPRCASEPGATPIPWPTSLPTQPPYPTRAAHSRVMGHQALTTMELPGGVDQLDLAVHPTENWPVVGMVHAPGLSDAPQTAMVRVLNPTTGRWGTAQQIDTGAAAIGPGGYGGLAVAVTGDGIVHAVWGRQTLWHGQSRDYGKTWETPEQIATGCWGVQDLAATLDGQLLAVTRCPEQATLLVRRSDGTWQPPQTVTFTIGFAQAVILGDGDTAMGHVLLSIPGENPRQLSIASGRLDTGTWTLRTIPIHLPDQQPPGAWLQNLRGLVISRHGQDVPLFTFAATNATNAFALWSLDAGTTWQVDPVIWQPPFNSAIEPHAEDGIDDVAAAYDPVADRFVALYVCCRPTRFHRREPRTLPRGVPQVAGSGSQIPRIPRPVHRWYWDRSQPVGRSPRRRVTAARSGWPGWNSSPASPCARWICRWCCHDHTTIHSSPPPYDTAAAHAVPGRPAGLRHAARCWRGLRAALGLSQSPTAALWCGWPAAL